MFYSFLKYLAFPCLSVLTMRHNPQDLQGFMFWKAVASRKIHLLLLPQHHSLWEVSTWPSFGQVPTTVQLGYSLTEQVMFHTYNPVAGPRKWEAGRDGRWRGELTRSWWSETFLTKPLTFMFRLVLYQACIPEQSSIQVPTPVSGWTLLPAHIVLPHRTPVIYFSL